MANSFKELIIFTVAAHSHGRHTPPVGVSTVFRANKVISACNHAVPLCLIYNNDMLMYVTSTDTHYTCMWVCVCACVQLVVTSFWARLSSNFAMGSRSPDLHLLRGLPLPATAPTLRAGSASASAVALSLLRVASTCAEANDDHSVRNAPEAAQKPIDYYLPHYISSFWDVSSEQIIFFVRLDTFKAKRQRDLAALAQTQAQALLAKPVWQVDRRENKREIE